MSALAGAISAQRVAAEPGVSTWLTANAGSGKTRVLTDRVARLLLAGVPPENILCLTFTKAAAGEMQNRLFATLGNWSMATDSVLEAELANLGETADLDHAGFANARRLFARAIDTPGGLKIQTIHAFAATILRMFPLEAGVAPGFVELDEVAANQLQRQVLDAMALDPADMRSLAALLSHVDGSMLANLMTEIVSEAPAFARPVDRPEVAGWFGADPDLTEDDLTRDLIGPGTGQMLRQVAAVLATGTKLDTDLGKAIAAALRHELTLSSLEGALLTNTGTIPARAPTQKTRTALADLAEDFDDLRQAVFDARQVRLTLDAIDGTVALHDFARRFLARYELTKTNLGQLDFNDLIRHAGRLLTHSDLAPWILYRLDGRIDHILVDEAQDTSPEQWAIIEALAAEFTAGESARSGVARTLFVVGDPKQSIFGFQGADLDAFDAQRDTFSERFGAAELPFNRRSLLHSFRSSPLILDLVDRVAAGSVGLGAAETHVSVRDALPGRVDLLEPLAKPKAERSKESDFGKVDLRTGEADTAVLLANDLAVRLKDMLATEAITDKDGQVRAMRPGDILVLLRRRGKFLGAFTAACKRLNLPIAGADRIKLGEELAVRDVISVLRFVDLPDDDLALAEALRSPLFGWSEQQLFTLASGRGERSLWGALRERPELVPGTVEPLQELLARADFVRPYDLIEMILTTQHGRSRLVARLGPECHDALDGLIDRALAFEELESPSLTQFLVWFDADETDLKRAPLQGQDMIRVMTVHGAKGLEAPVVVLPDAGQYPDRGGARLRKLDSGQTILMPRSDALTEALTALKDRDRTAEAAEDDRLLYVALTRPQSWLIVGAHNPVKDGDDSWYNRIAGAAAELGLETQEGVRRASFGQWPDRPDGSPAPKPEATKPLLKPLPPALRWTRPLSPSKLGPQVTGDGGIDEDSRARGVFIHMLLEYLPDEPEAERRELAFGLAVHEVGFDAKQAAEEALSVLSHPIFAEKAVAEIGFVADLAALGGQAVEGRIDRLVDMGDHLLIVDFKSDRSPPDSASAIKPIYLAQMGAYLAALQAVLPDRQVRIAILWTATATLMPLGNEIVMSALASAPTS